MWKKEFNQIKKKRICEDTQMKEESWRKTWDTHILLSIWNQIEGQDVWLFVPSYSFSPHKLKHAGQEIKLCSCPHMIHHMVEFFIVFVIFSARHSFLKDFSSFYNYVTFKLFRYFKFWPFKLMPAKTQPYCTLPKLNQSSSRPQINSCLPKSYKYQSLSSKSLLPAQINSNINY